MARIVFTSAAYWGDVVPFVPVANELVRRGHDVTYCVPEGHHDLLAGEAFTLADAGVPFSPTDLADDEIHRRMVERWGTRLAGARLGRYYVGTFVVGYLHSIVEHVATALTGAHLMVTHPTMGVASGIAADAAGVPWITGHLFPMLLPTDERPPWALPVKARSGSNAKELNRRLWDGVRTVTGLTTFDRPINRFRQARGLAPIRAAALFGGLSDRRTLLLASRHYVDAPADWADRNIELTGFAVWDGPAGGRLDPRVDAFLDAGAPPLLVTMGSGPSAAGSAAFREAAAALHRLGLRGLFLVGRQSPLTSADLPGDVAVAPFAPLGAVLPRCRAAVHAGGHGTTAAVMTAGRPSVVAPVLFDQLWHGRRVEELGLGQLVRRWRRPGRLEAAVTQVVSDPGYARRAEEMAALLATEDGVTAAADAVEAVL